MATLWLDADPGEVLALLQADAAGAVSAASSDRFPAPPIVVLALDILAVTSDTGGACV
jgi:hypothetical protein